MVAISLLGNSIISEQKNISINDSLSHRLNYALKVLNISQSELARRLDIKPQTIHYICANNVKKSRFTFGIASVLDIDYTWLAAGKGAMQSNVSEREDNLEHATYKTPIISLENIAKFVKNQVNYSNLEIQDWMITNFKPCEESIAFINMDSAMEPPFPAGSILMIDTQAHANSNDFILAYIKRWDKLFFRQFSLENGLKLLKPFSQHVFKIIELESEDVIVGRLVQTHFAVR